MFYDRDCLTKLTVILPRNSANPPCLGHLGLRDTNRTNPICVISPKVAKANGTDVIEQHIRNTYAGK
jgi:hypothetical protein